MITSDQSSLLKEQAYVPEHITDYVTSVSDCEPFLSDTILYYRKGSTLIVVGYPLDGRFHEKTLRRFLERAEREVGPEEAILIAPEVPGDRRKYHLLQSDFYYRLEIARANARPKVKNMVRRASRELVVERTREWTPEHERLVAEFLERRTLDANTVSILRRISRYVSCSDRVLVLNARDQKGSLAAFDVMDQGSRDYAFYMFNIASGDRCLPGASDLLLSELIDTAAEAGKRFVNLGLGINEGVTFFKKKWGGEPFLPYRHCRRPAGMGTAIMSLLDRL